LYDPAACSELFIEHYSRTVFWMKCWCVHITTLSRGQCLAQHLPVTAW
jgi:hypothetical protein